MKQHLRLGTRGSPLALWQADHITALLLAAHPGLTIERVIIKEYLCFILSGSTQ